MKKWLHIHRIMPIAVRDVAMGEGGGWCKQTLRSLPKTSFFYSWDFFLVDFVVPWRTRRSWRRRHRTRTTLWGNNQRPVSVENYHQTETGLRFLSKRGRSSSSSPISIDLLLLQGPSRWLRKEMEVLWDYDILLSLQYKGTRFGWKISDLDLFFWS